jgi:hypothetical protein
MDFETEVGQCDPLDINCVARVAAKYGIPTIQATAPNPALAAGFQMDANALAAAGLNPFTSSANTATTGGGNITLQDILNLPLTEEAKLRRAEEAYANAVLDLREYNKSRKYDILPASGGASDEEDLNFFMGSEWDKQGGQKGRQEAVQVAKAALEGLGGSPYGSLLKRGVVTTAQLAGNIVNRAMNTVGGPNFNQVTLNPLQGSVTGQYTDSGPYTPLKIAETADGTIVAASTGIPALDAIIGGSTTTDADGGISGIKKPDFGTIWENIGGVGGIAGTLGLSGENTSETFDPTTVVADDTVVTNPGTVVTLGGLSPQEIAYNKAMKVFDDAGGGEAGKAAVLQALEDNGLTIADLSTQTGVSIAELETFLTPAGTGTVSDPSKSKVETFSDAPTAVGGLGALAQDPNIAADIDALQQDPNIAADIDALKTKPGYTRDIDALTTKPDYAGSIAMLKGEPNIAGSEVIIGEKPAHKWSMEELKGQPNIAGSEIEIGEEPSYRWGMNALDQEVIATGDMEALNQEAAARGESRIWGSPMERAMVVLNQEAVVQGSVADDTRYTTTRAGKVGDAQEVDSLRGSAVNVGESPVLTGTLRETEVDPSLYGELVRDVASPVQKVSALETSTLRGSSTPGGSGGMAAPGGSGVGVGAGGPGDLVDIEYLFERFGDTIFAPRLTEEEEDDLLYAYT